MSTGQDPAAEEAALIAWLEAARAASGLSTRPVRLADCPDWRLDRGRLVHRTGRFFSVVGLADPDGTHGLQGGAQPMIDQPELGWLGFLMRRGRDDIEWLLQAKTEPGNMRGTEFAPSLQATRSNYMRLHGGRPTRFLELFRAGGAFLSDAPHSEQGTRFLWKFNRNSVLALPPGSAPEPGTGENWRWASGRALRRLLGRSHLVNTDARSVIASAPWALLAGGGPLFRAGCLARSYRIAAPGPARLLNHAGPARWPRWRLVGLPELPGWRPGDSRLVTHAGTGVALHAVAARDREVPRWCQPFLVQDRPAEAVLLMRLHDGVAQVFLRILREPGFGGRAEFGPSLHSAFETPPPLAELAGRHRGRDLAVLHQGDEGGRFMRAETVYRIRLLPRTPPRQRHPFGLWVDLATLESLTRRAGTTTNELRTLASMILSADFDAACADLG